MVLKNLKYVVIFQFKMIELNKWVVSIGTIILFVLLSFLSIFIINKILKLTSKKITLDNRIAKALRTPLRLVIVLIGIFIANFYLEPDLRINGFNFVVFYKIIVIFVFIYALINVIKAFFIWYVENLRVKKHTKIDDTIFHFLNKVISIVFYLIAILLSLSLLGIEIKPILAGLGIAGLAVALALQDTLGNFFSAIYIAVDQPIKIGDFIEIPGGEKGYVSEIGWRSTRLKTRENNIVVIPNSKIVQSIVINYHQVQSRFRVEVSVGVNYGSDLESVERITVETAKKVMKELEPEIKDFEPYVRYDNFGDSSINFKISLMTDNVENKSLLIHKFIKELTNEFRKNKIEIPYPQRDVHLKK